MESKQFTPKLEELRSMLLWIRARTKGSGFSEKILKEIELCSEEVIVNILKHSGIDKGDFIEIIVSETDGVFRISFKNKGKDFNPLKNIPEIQSHKKLEDREEGGLGIFFMSQLMDGIEYERSGKYNILTLLKRKVIDSSQSKST